MKLNAVTPGLIAARAICVNLSANGQQRLSSSTPVSRPFARKSKTTWAVQILAAFGVCISAIAQQDIITTVAGGGPNGIPAVNANVSVVQHLAYDRRGSLYFTSTGQNRLYKIDPAGLITVVAGNGQPGYSGDGGPAASAEILGWGVAVDNAIPANVYLADSFNCLVRKIDQSTGIITTVAGLVNYPTGGAPYPSCGFSGDGGPANQAQLNYVAGLALDPRNNDLYIAEYQNGLVRKVAGGTATGTITTVAGGGGADGPAQCEGTPPYGDGAPATEAYLCYPQGLALDTTVSPANLFITEGSFGARCTVREVVGSSRNIYLVAGSYNNCAYLDNVPATQGLINNPQQIQVSVHGTTSTLTFADWGNSSVRQFPLTYLKGVPQPGTITTIAGGQYGYCGDNGPVLDACLANPTGVIYDPFGDLFIGEFGNSRVREVVRESGDMNTVAGWGYYGNTITTYSDPANLGIVPATGISVFSPHSVNAFRGSPNLYLGGALTPAVYEFNPDTGRARTFAGNGIPGFAGDGTAADSAGTELVYPTGEAIDSKGNIYIGDSNCAIREVIASTGLITTIAGGTEGQLNGCGYSGDNGPATAAQINGPGGIAIDSHDNLYFNEYVTCDVRKVVLSTGIITTVAGTHLCGFNGDYGLAADTQLNAPTAVAPDAAGNLYIADFLNQRIRKVSLAFGTIQTIAGNGIAGYSGDGIAIDNSLNYPNQIAVDASGNLFIADQNNNLLRWIDPAGQLVTFAGLPPTTPGGNYGYTGDGGPAKLATFNTPSGITQDSYGNFYAADSNNNVVREVTAFAGYGRSTAHLTFEKQPIGSRCRHQSITLSAIGPVTIREITTPEGFTEIDNCKGRRLDAGETCNIDVAFKPTRNGTVQGSLTIASDAFFTNQGNTVALEGETSGFSAPEAPQ
jgi:sugar lactone lactonase YvrE